jgi:S1-C subfamily serine protease
MTQKTTLAEDIAEAKKLRNRKIFIGLAIFAIIGFFIIPKLIERYTSKEIVCLKNQTEIYEKYKDAVVLVKHTFGFKISIKGCEPFVLQVGGLDNQTVYGTGFFVSDDGKIITNHHVAEPWLYEQNKETPNYIKERIAEILPDSIPETEYKTFLENKWNEYDEDYEEEGDVEVSNPIVLDSAAAIVEVVAETAATSQEPEKSINYVSIDDIVVEGKTIEISVATHGSNENWLDCKILKVSDDQEVDIAVLQPNDNQLPATVGNIINLKEAVLDDQTLKPGTNAILIGYPMGMTLANTKRGIKVQVYEGQINKESDGVSLQYNVTSTHGASGSPVFNECGQLIAINYAGFDQAQGYNFGIVAKHAFKLIE